MLITSGHYFDIAGGFELEEESWIAGYGSQFWPHGFGVEYHNVRIGKRCFLGLAVRFAPGASIANDTVVSIGSVVTKKFQEEKVLIGGIPAEILKKDYIGSRRQRCR